MDAYLTKPVDSRRLVKVVESLARRPDAATGPWAPPDSIPSEETLGLEASRPAGKS
jgi:DNA-binding response OmpR family regulator